MVNSFKALTLALFLCLGITAANAGYAQATPPKGWSAGGFNGGVAANGATYYPGGVRTSASINVGGRSVTLPASMRFASNAPRFAASAIYLHPGLRTAAAIATWLGIAGLVYDATSGLWQDTNQQDGFLSPGVYYCAHPNNLHGNHFCNISTNLKFGSIKPAVDHLYNLCVKLIRPNDILDCRVEYENKRNMYKYGNEWIGRYPGEDKSCPAGWYVTPAGCVQGQSVKTIESEEEFLERLVPHPMPEEVPKHIPEPLPVEIPVIDPVFVPTGNPRPNPVYDPSAEPSPENQPWIQPGTKIQPAPTPRSPWQVDLQPVNRPTSSPDPKPDISIEPKPDNDNPPTNPPGETPVTPGLCDQYPDILACAKLEEPEEKLPEVKISEEFQFMDGFYSSATCPVFPQIHMLPGLSWQPFCDQLARIRPLVLAFAWLSAVMIILKYGRK